MAGIRSHFSTSGSEERDASCRPVYHGSCGNPSQGSVPRPMHIYIYIYMHIGMLAFLLQRHTPAAARSYLATWAHAYPLAIRSFVQGEREKHVCPWLPAVSGLYLATYRVPIVVQGTVKASGCPPRRGLFSNEFRVFSTAIHHCRTQLRRPPRRRRTHILPLRAPSKPTLCHVTHHRHRHHWLRPHCVHWTRLMPPAYLEPRRTRLSQRWGPPWRARRRMQR